MPDFDGSRYLTEFFAAIRSEGMLVYNEIGLQNELGYFLRSALPADLVVEFERPAHACGVSRRLVKKEIDLLVRTRTEPYRYWAIELKAPRNGQHPEQMFSACKDLQFLEQLCEAGFEGGWFAIHVNDALFYRNNPIASGIYAYFRAGTPIHGAIQKPTGRSEQFVHITGSYPITWQVFDAKQRFAIVEVRSQADAK